MPWCSVDMFTAAWLVHRNNKAPASYTIVRTQRLSNFHFVTCKLNDQLNDYKTKWLALLVGFAPPLPGLYSRPAGKAPLRRQ